MDSVMAAQVLVGRLAAAKGSKEVRLLYIIGWLQAYCSQCVSQVGTSTGILGRLGRTAPTPACLRLPAHKNLYLIEIPVVASPRHIDTDLPCLLLDVRHQSCQMKVNLRCPASMSQRGSSRAHDGSALMRFACCSIGIPLCHAANAVILREEGILFQIALWKPLEG